MNWIDGVVAAIILGFGAIGLLNGFIMSVFRLASFFISVFLAMKFYPAVTAILTKTALFTFLKGSIANGISVRMQTQQVNANTQVKQAAADGVINSLPLPVFLKTSLTDRIPDVSKTVDTSRITGVISEELAGIIIAVISLVVLFLLIRIGMIFLKFILSGIARLPVFKQVNKLGGFALGAVEGLLTVYILCAVLMLFNTSPQFKGIFDAVDNSIVAKLFYQHNIIIDLMFPKNTG